MNKDLKDYCDDLKAQTELNHPCKDNCSGWKQGYEKGKSEVKPIDWATIWIEYYLQTESIDNEELIQELVERALKGQL